MLLMLRLRRRHGADLGPSADILPAPGLNAKGRINAVAGDYRHRHTFCHADIPAILHTQPGFRMTPGLVKGILAKG